MPPAVRWGHLIMTGRSLPREFALPRASRARGTRLDVRTDVADDSRAIEVAGERRIGEAEVAVGTIRVGRAAAGVLVDDLVTVVITAVAALGHVVLAGVAVVVCA